MCFIHYAENVPFWRPFCFGWPSAQIRAAKRWSPCRGRPHPLAPRGKSSGRAPVPSGILLRQLLPAMLVLVYLTRGRTWRLSTLFHAWNITQHTTREKNSFLPCQPIQLSFRIPWVFPPSLPKLVLTNSKAEIASKMKTSHTALDEIPDASDCVFMCMRTQPLPLPDMAH